MEDELMKYEFSKILLGMDITDEFDETTELVDLGIDSIQFLEMVVRIEELFGISIEDEDLIGENFETIGTVLTMMDKYLE
jgi:acyl carrier protein